MERRWTLCLSWYECLRFQRKVSSVTKTLYFHKQQQLQNQSGDGASCGYLPSLRGESERAQLPYGSVILVQFVLDSGVELKDRVVRVCGVSTAGSRGHGK